MYSVQEINIKDCIYCFFDALIKRKHFHPNKIKVDEYSYKNILTYYINYKTTKIVKPI